MAANNKVSASSFQFARHIIFSHYPNFGYLDVEQMQTKVRVRPCIYVFVLPTNSSQPLARTVEFIIDIKKVAYYNTLFMAG